MYDLVSVECNEHSRAITEYSVGILPAFTSGTAKNSRNIFVNRRFFVFFFL